MSTVYVYVLICIYYVSAVCVYVYFALVCTYTYANVYIQVCLHVHHISYSTRVLGSTGAGEPDHAAAGNAGRGSQQSCGFVPLIL